MSILQICEYPTNASYGISSLGGRIDTRRMSLVKMGNAVLLVSTILVSYTVTLTTLSIMENILAYPVAALHG